MKNALNFQHSADMDALRRTLDLACATKNIPTVANESVHDHLARFLIASGTNNNQSALVLEQQLRQHYQDEQNQVRDHMVDALRTLGLPTATGDSLESYTVSWLSQVHTIPRRLQLVEEEQERLNNSVTEHYTRLCGAKFNAWDSLEVKLSRLATTAETLATTRVQDEHSRLKQCILPILQESTSAIGIGRLNGSINEQVTQFAHEITSRFEACNHILNSIWATVQVSVQDNNLTVSMAGDDSVDCLLLEYSREVQSKVSTLSTLHAHAVSESQKKDERISECYERLEQSAQALLPHMQLRGAASLEDLLVEYVAATTARITELAFQHDTIDAELDTADTALSLGISGLPDTSIDLKVQRFVQAMQTTIRDTSSVSIARDNALISQLTTAYSDALIPDLPTAILEKSWSTISECARCFQRRILTSTTAYTP